MLGPKEDRTPTRPVYNDQGDLTGGIAFERGTSIPANTNQGQRCYATSITVQPAEGNLTQPSVNLRDPRPEDPTLLKDFNEVSYPYLA